MKRIVFLLLAAFVCGIAPVLAQNPFGSLQRPQQQPLPPELYRNLDSRRMVDPRVIEQQRLKQEGKDKQRQFDEVKQQYSSMLWQRVNNTDAYRGLTQDAHVSLSMAVNYAATYYATKQIEGVENAERWLATIKDSLRKGVADAAARQPLFVAHDTAVAVAAGLAGQPSKEMQKQGLAKDGAGYAMNMGQKNDKVSTGLAGTLRYLEELVH